MSTRKKIIISISTVCVALVVALVTVISIFAASQQGTTSQIAVTYKATNVSAKISGDYMIEGDETYTSMGEAVEFTPLDVNTTKTIGLNGLELRDDKTYVLLRYTFENNSDTAKIKISTTVNKNAESYNTRVASAYTTEELTQHYNLISSTNLDDAILTGGGSAYVYVKIDVNSPANDASFTGTVDFNLEYTEETNITETLGIAKVGDIVERGEYPQTFVGTDLNVQLLALQSAGALDETGRTFTTYTGNYENPTQVICKEYLYNKERYVMVESVLFSIGSYTDSPATFSTGETVGNSGKDLNDGDTLFFKVEPLKFQVMALDVDNGEMTLWSEMLIGGMYFNHLGGGNLWQNSDTRLYLNDRFLKDSYLGYAPKQVQIENNVTEEYYENTGTPTQDRLWLPAVTDLVEWYPDEEIEVYGTYEILIKMPTDFAMATYTHSDNRYNDVGYYYLRSMGNDSEFTCVVTPYGDIDDCYSGYACNDAGLCPAFVTEL